MRKLRFLIILTLLFFLVSLLFFMVFFACFRAKPKSKNEENVGQPEVPLTKPNSTQTYPICPVGVNKKPRTKKPSESLSTSTSVSIPSVPKEEEYSSSVKSNVSTDIERMRNSSNTDDESDLSFDFLNDNLKTGNTDESVIEKFDKIEIDPITEAGTSPIDEVKGDFVGEGDIDAEEVACQIMKDLVSNTCDIVESEKNGSSTNSSPSFEKIELEESETLKELEDNQQKI